MRFSILAAALLAPAAFASTIVSSTYLTGFSTTSSAGGGLLAVSWTQTTSYTDVSVEADLAANNGLSEAIGTAYLMKEIGAGTTAISDEIASAPVSVSGNPGLDNLTSVFSSLSLGPGTYYLVIEPASVNNVDSLEWDMAGMPSQTFGTGVSDVMAFAGTTTNAAFPPANTFASELSTPIFSVTGDLGVITSPTPEPSTTILLACGLGALAVAHKFVARRSRS